MLIKQAFALKKSKILNKALTALTLSKTTWSSILKVKVKIINHWMFLTGKVNLIV